MQKILDCSQKLLATVVTILDPEQPENSIIDDDFSNLKSTLRMRLIGPLSTIVGYCKILLKEAPAALTLGIEEVNSAAQQLLGQINDIPNLARRQIQKIETQIQKTNGRLLVQASVESMWKAAANNDCEEPAVARTAENKRFQNLRNQIAGNYLDVERLYRPSLYPSLASFAKEDELISIQSAPTVISSEFTHLQAEQAQTLETFSDSELSSLSRCCKIVAVQSFRGGTGKSSIVSNLAVNPAGQGKRVGIIDIDLPSPSIHMLLGLADTSINKTINDYLWSNCELHECAYNLTSHLPEKAVANGGAIHLTPASAQLKDIIRVLQTDYDRRKLFDGFQIISNDLKLDILLIDTHPGVNEETLQAIAGCSLLVLVLRPEYQDYRGTSIIVELAQELSVQEMLLVVNKAPQSFDITEYREQLEAAYKVRVADVLPFSEEMMSLTSSELFSAHYFNHPLVKVMDEISRRIIND